MRTYIAKYGKQRFTGGLFQCINWGRHEAEESTSIVVKIHKARAGEKLARVVAEVTSENVQMIEHGRYVPLRRLGVKHGKV